MTIEFDGQNNKLGTTTADSVTIKTNDTDALTVDSSANLQFNSGYGSVATAYGCRAWVNFNGSGTVAIRDSGNVSSITDNGTGDYTVNFSTALVDDDYSAIVQAGNVATANNQSATTSSNIYSNSSFRFGAFNINGARVDYEALSLAVFR